MSDEERGAVDVVSRVLVLIALIALPLVIVGLLGFAMGIHPPKITSARTPADYGWTFETISLRTRDGLTLSGWFVPRDAEPGRRPVIIVLHGYPYDKASVLGVTPFLHQHYDLLLVDFRFFGQSEGQLTTFGYREWQDVVAAVDYARDRGPAAVGIWGFSFGGAVALLALPRTDGIDAVVVDSPFASMDAMVADYYRAFPIADRLLAAFTDALSRLVLGFTPADVSPERAIADTTTPIMLIHSMADATIPVRHHEALKRALAQNPNAEFWLLERGAHGMTYASDQAAYEARVLDFFARHLISSTPAPEPTSGGAARAPNSLSVRPAD